MGYADLVKADSPWAYWPLIDKGAITLLDWSGNGRSLTQNDGPSGAGPITVVTDGPDADVKLIQQVIDIAATATTTKTVTLSQAVTAGNTLMVMISEYNATSLAVTSISGCGATWMQVKRSTVAADGIASSIWIGLNPTGGTTITTTASGAMQNDTEVTEWAGLDNSQTMWQANTGAADIPGSPTAITTNPVTPQPGDLVVGIFQTNVSTATFTESSTPSNFTALTGDANATLVSYKVATAAVAHEFKGSVNNNVYARGCIAVIPRRMPSGPRMGQSKVRFPDANFNLYGTQTQYAYFVASSLPTLSGAFSVEAWTLSPSKDIGHSLRLAGSRAPSDFGFVLTMQDDGYVAVSVGNGSSFLASEFTATSPVLLGRWNHIVLVVTTTGCTIYVNGVAVGSTTWSTATPIAADSSHNVYIGASGKTNDRATKSAVSDVAIYPVALTADQIKSHYQAGKRLGALAGQGYGG